MSACPTGAYLFDGESFLRLEASDLLFAQSVFEVRTHDGLVYAGATGGCSEEVSPATLSVCDPTTDAPTVLIPPPPGDTFSMMGLRPWAIGR